MITKILRPSQSFTSRYSLILAGNSSPLNESKRFITVCKAFTDNTPPCPVNVICPYTTHFFKNLLQNYPPIYDWTLQVISLLQVFCLNYECILYFLSVWVQVLPLYSYLMRWSYSNNTVTNTNYGHPHYIWCPQMDYIYVFILQQRTRFKTHLQ